VNTIGIGLQTMTWETKELEPLNIAAAARDQAKAELVFNVAEKQGITARIVSLQTELRKLQATLNEIKSSLDTAKADYQALKSDMRLFCKELAIKYEANALINSYWCDADKVDIGLMSEAEYRNIVTTFITELSDILEIFGNPELSQKWKDAMLAAGKKDEKGFKTNFAAVVDLVTELIRNDIVALYAKLG